MPTRTLHNRLNDLEPKEWLKFQKSWFIHNPPPRSKDVLRHPAKFPETLVQQFIEFFTKREMNVLDPMLGTGSTMIACIRSGRNGFGIEINPKYAEIAQNEVDAEIAQLDLFNEHPEIRIIHGDVNDTPLFNLPMIDYCITSPPYWNMLRVRGADTQKKRRGSRELDVYYSDDPDDLGNIEDYDVFVESLVSIYQKIFNVMRDRAYITIIVKNVKKQGKIFPLAWDLGKEVGKIFTLKDEKIWCQDNIRLAPYGLGNAWVSNTFHHYCLQFRKEAE
jgi:DNA modification methylase